MGKRIFLAQTLGNGCCLVETVNLNLDPADTITQVEKLLCLIEIYISKVGINKAATLLENANNLKRLHLRDHPKGCDCKHRRDNIN